MFAIPRRLVPDIRYEQEHRVIKKRQSLMNDLSGIIATTIGTISLFLDIDSLIYYHIYLKNYME